MKLKKIDENIYTIEGTRSCNIYYLDFEKKALVDTGHELEIDSIIDIFKESDIDLSNLDYILCTHSHGDHVGGAAAIKSLSKKCKVVASTKFKKYQDLKETVALLKGAEDKYTRFDVECLVTSGDTINLGNFELEVMETPGHTKDSIVFINHEKKLAFTGDLVYKGLTTQVDYYQSLLVSLDELIETYDKMLKIPLDIYYTGHGPAIEEPLKSIEQGQKKLKRFKAKPEMLVVSNFIPSMEFYIFKNPGIVKEKIIDFFYENMMKFEKDELLESITPEKFLEIIDKILSLMKFMNMITINDNRYYLINNINSNIKK